VKDPEIMLDIVNLGLIYGIKIEEDRKVITVDMTFTSPGCPMGPQILTDTHQTLMRAFPQLEDVQVNLVWVPFWNPQMMSEEAKDELGYF
jgi:metal-sulfur cluster biosynthetic enzyme